MKSQTAAELGEKTRSMANKLVAMVNGYASDRNRIRGLVLFEERVAEKCTRAISTVNYHDRPEVELILHHRDQYLKLTRMIDDAGMAIECARKMLKDGNDSYIEALSNAIASLARVETQRANHLKSMEIILANMTKEMGDQETIMARLAADAAHMAQKASEHRDKMDLARKSAEIPTTAELQQRLALKYNVPIEQVESILAAKAVDAEAD